jgi:macrolide-specific efflux system membrane fusion protein
MTKKKWMGALVVLAAAGAVAYHWKAPKSAAPALRTVAVERGDVEVTVSATGIVQPRNRLEIKPAIPGRLEDVLAREGDRVHKGQVLAWMSSSERAALLDAARAKGKAELAHWEELYRPAPLSAPLDGVIIDRKVEPGQTVSAQDALFVMSDRLIVKAQVDETDIGRVKKGQPTSVTLDAYPDEAVSGEVEHIAFEATTVNNVTIYEVDVLPRRVPEFMRSGMTANVLFRVAARENVLVVPAEAVHSGRGGEEVLASAPGGGEPVRRAVKLGLSDGKRTEVLEGLQEGDSVLVAGIAFPKSRARGTNPFFPSGVGGRRGGGARGSRTGS